MMRVPDGWRLVAVVVLAGLALVSFLGWRAYENKNAQQSLCEKIDRFIVAVEKGVRANPTLSPVEKAERIRFYEGFRNDPPVCRTTP